MNAHVLIHNRISQTNLLAWTGSFFLHGVIILASLSFLTPTPAKQASQTLKWNVSLIQPAPSSVPTEHVQTVTRPSPTRHPTLSRPLHDRHMVEHRPIQREQASTHQTAARPQNIHKPIKTQKTPQRAHTSPQSRPKQVAQALTPVTPKPTNRQQVSRRKTSTPSRVLPPAQAYPQTVRATVSQNVRATQYEVTSVATQSVQMGKHKPSSKVAETSHKAMTTMTSTVQTKSRPAQPQQQTIAQSTNQRQIASTNQGIQRPPQQTVINAGSPERHFTKQLRHRSQTSSRKHVATQSRRQASSNKTVTSNQLSAEALAFLKLLREKIEKHRKYPRVAKRLGYQGTTTLSFALSHNGDLKVLQVADPSGHSMLDEAALAAVQRIMPLKPPAMIGDTLIEIPVAFELTR